MIVIVMFCFLRVLFDWGREERKRKKNSFVIVRAIVEVGLELVDMIVFGEAPGFGNMKVQLGLILGMLLVLVGWMYGECGG